MTTAFSSAVPLLGHDAEHDGGVATDPTVRERYAAAGELLRALSSPLRLALITELSLGSRCVHELVDALQVPQPLVSQHLKVLRSANVVSAQRRGREMAYQLTDSHIAHIAADAISHAGEL